MADKREQILARLTAVAGGVAGISVAERNGMNLAETQRPAIVVMDGNEQAEDTTSEKSRAPRRIVMSPLVYVIASGDTGAIGTELNSLRAALVKAVMTDATLISLVGPNGEITYEGCETGLARGRQIEGEMGVHFAFAYILDPSTII